MRTVLAVVACLLMTATALATTPTSAITGHVTSGDAPAAGVTVTATSNGLQGGRSTITNEDGRYFLTALPPGRYEVTFSRKGLQTLTRRAVVELARVARADAVLEPSEDEESVTSTALTVGVSDATILTTHLSDEMLDRLPIRRDPVSASALTGMAFGPPILLDDALSYFNEGQEAHEQVTILRAGLTADYGFPGPLTTARTRAGGEESFVTLRDTFDEQDHDHFLEGAAGGRIVKEKLWYFASAWTDGLEAKLTAQPRARHNLMALYAEGDGAHLATLRYLGTAGPTMTNEVYASRTSGPSQLIAPPARVERETLFAKSTWIRGRHVLSGGAELADDSALFVNDRILAGRWTVNAGARYDRDRLTPRLGASYDLRGNGRHAVVANFGDYSLGAFRLRELTLGYAGAIGNTGSARVDLLRRNYGFGAVNGAEGTFTYSLFDRFHTGANYKYVEDEHAANAWAGIDVPAGSHQFGVTVLERYQLETFATDLALRYTLPISRLALTLATDVVDVFNRSRAWRAWIRVRV